jgi:uncharacterized coiled-coil protein SlyX
MSNPDDRTPWQEADARVEAKVEGLEIRIAAMERALKKLVGSVFAVVAKNAKLERDMKELKQGGTVN